MDGLICSSQCASAATTPCVCVLQVFVLVVLGCVLLAGCCLADSRGSWGVPAPGFAYGMYHDVFVPSVPRSMH